MAEAQLIFGEVIYLDGRREGHGMIAAHSFEKQRVAHALVIGLILYLASSGQRKGMSQEELKHGVFAVLDEK